MIHDQLSGVVVPGQGRGKALGFPTANIKLHHGQIQPPTGVFAARAELPKKQFWLAAVHIGPAPTFNDSTYRIEVHLLDYEGGSLYGQPLTVELVKKIRDVKKFATEDELSAAITADCIEARQILTAEQKK
jgi:riboflavin kinase/FMN adenylyltransferase